MKKIIFALLIASFFANAEQDEGERLLNAAIVNAKLAGVCGAYKQMADFQAATQMPGGDDFINRFGATEVARLGMTSQEFIDLCSKAIDQYNKMNRMTQSQ